MKTLLIFLICPFFFCSAQEVKKEETVRSLYRYDQYGIREVLPTQIIKETPYKIEIYNTQYGIPEITPTYEIISYPQQLHQGLEIYTLPVEVPVPVDVEYLGSDLDY